jgi:threonine aldolase
MRAAMAAAEVGDDMFGEDPTVAKLEARVAELLGKQAAILGGLAGSLVAAIAYLRLERLVCGKNAA